VTAPGRGMAPGPGHALRSAVGAATGAAVALACLLSVPAPADAQSVRVTGSTVLRYVEVRPLVRDSVPAEEVGGRGLLRQTADGQVVRCMMGDLFCRGTSPGDRVSSIPSTQDLEVSVWGFGEGLRGFAHLRGRTAWGSNPDLWPQADEALDVLAAYGELDRERYRVRAGRQWTTSGLGFYNFDGLALTVRPIPGLSVDGQVGRSLVRGLNEPRTGGALEAIEELAPIEPGLMLSGQLRYRPSPRLALSALYHRDVRDDRAGLYSELARAEGVFRFGEASVEGAMEADLAGGEFNELRLRVRAPPVLSTALSAEVRRYRPYFELWTIWGAFSPVGFDEGRLDLTWATARGDLILRGEASYRSYDDTGMETGVGRFRTDGWGLGARANWSPWEEWRLEGGYRMEVGFGAARSEGNAGVQRHLGDRGHVAVRGLAFQRLYEFRLDHGVVVGLGAEGGFRLTDRSRAVGSVTGYRHVDRGDRSDMDWTQLRANLRLQWTIGPEPGLTRTAPRIP
jgi:hypothetical protein